MTILCFLQNLWLKNPDRWKEYIDRNEARRPEIIAHLLLAYGCLTGRRIKACFGDLLPHMIFEEASREIAGDPRTICPPDPEHIKACIEKYKPKVVLTFGKVAAATVRPHFIAWGLFNPRPDGARFIALPHPAARQKDTVAKLRAAAAQIRGILNREGAKELVNGN